VEEFDAGYGQVSFPEAYVAVRVPFGRPVNPVTGTNWEGVGVAPDIVVPADEALAVAHAEALRTLRQPHAAAVCSAVSPTSP
jgi:hypothetical protein